MHRGNPRLPVAPRLAAHSERAESGCLLWMGYRNAAGYGVIGKNGRIVLAHRAAWEEVHDDIPSGMKVCHACDVRNCIEPTHLWLGTQAENNADMVAKGRAVVPVGWNQGQQHSAETRSRISVAMAGRRTGYRQTAATRAKIAAKMVESHRRRGHQMSSP